MTFDAAIVAAHYRTSCKPRTRRCFVGELEGSEPFVEYLVYSHDGIWQALCVTATDLPHVDVEWYVNRWHANEAE